MTSQKPNPKALKYRDYREMIDRESRNVDAITDTGEILTAGIPEEWLRPTYRSGWKL